MWAQAWATLLLSVGRFNTQANRHQTPALLYQVGQRVWLSFQDLPLWMEYRKLASRFVGPFTIQGVVSPTAVRLWLLRTMKVHPTFHISKVHKSPLVPASPPPPHLIDGGLSFTVRRLIHSQSGA